MSHTILSKVLYFVQAAESSHLAAHTDPNLIDLARRLQLHLVPRRDVTELRLVVT